MVLGYSSRFLMQAKVRHIDGKESYFDEIFRTYVVVLPRMGDIHIPHLAGQKFVNSPFNLA